MAITGVEKRRHEKRKEKNKPQESLAQLKEPQEEKKTVRGPERSA